MAVVVETPLVSQRTAVQTSPEHGAQMTSDDFAAGERLGVGVCWIFGMMKP